MEVEIIRRYYPEGTNGRIYVDGELQCFCIELPWLENRYGKSCIPEGRYELKARHNDHFGDHFEVLNVEDRSGILLHPANHALKELKGCIAPVSYLTGQGEGEYSRDALDILCHLIYPELKKKKVFLTIKSNNHDTHTKDTIPYAAIF
jgi:Family of unknown function (DUF5675)